MINKKILLSVLIIGFVGVAAASGTWAVYQNTVNANDNKFDMAAWGIKAEYANPLSPTSEETDAAGFKSVSYDAEGVGTMDAGIALGVIPHNAGVPYFLKDLKFTNTGVPARVTAEVVGNPTMPAGITLYFDGAPEFADSSVLYDGTWHECTRDLSTGSTVWTNLRYNFDDSVNNNADAGKSYPFSLKFTVNPII